jgi:TolB-like protein/Tfp pilus assembly protein PilF
VSLFEELKRRNVFRVAIAYAVVAWLVLQVADVVLNNIEAPDWIFQVLMLMFAIGLPLALVFAWVYEMTPDGIRRENDIDRSQSITPNTGRKLDRVISIALAVAVSYLLVDKLWLSAQDLGSTPPPVATDVAGELAPGPATATGVTDSGAESGVLSIAVLPFVNMSADADNEYFSDGISEELLNVLVKVSTLHVASRTSAFAYKDKDLPVSQIASELQVNHILEGSVRKAGNRVRITAQLIDGRSDRHLWSETYERELDDIFEIQEEISNAIVDALKIALDVNEVQAMERAQRPTDNLEAYEIFLQGRHLWRLRTAENIRSAIALFKKAVALDPQFAAAWESLAGATGSLSSWTQDPEEGTLDEAIVYARKALELDPTRAEARAIVGEYHGEHRQWAELMDEYRRVVADAPNSGMLHMWRGEILHNLGYTDAALDELLTAYELDPALGVVSNVMVYVSQGAGRYDLTLKHLGIARELGLEQTATRNAAPLFMMRGELEPLIEYYGWNEDDMPLCLRAIRDPAAEPELKAALLRLDLTSMEQLTAITGPLVTSLDLCYTRVGLDDEAVAMLGNIIRTQDWYVINKFWQRDEGTRRLRQNPHFKALVQEMGLVDYWREHGWPDLCRADGTDDFACD